MAPNSSHHKVSLDPLEEIDRERQRVLEVGYLYGGVPISTEDAQYLDTLHRFPELAKAFQESLRSISSTAISGAVSQNATRGITTPNVLNNGASDAQRYLYIAAQPTAMGLSPSPIGFSPSSTGRSLNSISWSTSPMGNVPVVQLWPVNPNLVAGNPVVANAFGGPPIAIPSVTPIPAVTPMPNRKHDNNIAPVYRWAYVYSLPQKRYVCIKVLLDCNSVVSWGPEELFAGESVTIAQFKQCYSSYGRHLKSDRMASINWHGSSPWSIRSKFYVASEAGFNHEVIIGKDILEKHGEAAFLSEEPQSRTNERRPPVAGAARVPASILGAETCDVPITDSSYASAARQIHCSDIHPAVKSKDDNREKHMAQPSDSRGDEPRTVMSTGTKTLPGIAQRSLDDICNDIHDKIAPHLEEGNWKNLSRSIPELIKAFAIKIGLDTSHKVNGELMHFIYKYHREFGYQLHEKLQIGNEARVPHDNDQEPMSLMDKMSLWAAGSPFDGIRVKDSEYLEGVEDSGGGDVEEDHEQGQFSAYSEAVTNSPAYEWFIGSLCRVASRQRDESRPSSKIEDIRQAILEYLPTGRITKRLPPKVHTIACQIPLQSLKSRLEAEVRNGPEAEQRTISNLLAATCHSEDQIQATTIRSYLDKTWASRANGILDILQRADDHVAGECFSIILPDAVKIVAHFEEQCLILAITGSAYSIAERVEQLAWLVSALQPSNPHSVVLSTPIIKRGFSYQVSFMDPDWRHRWTIEFKNDTLDEEIPLSFFPNTGWPKELVYPVIVRGYPTDHRAKSWAGIEMTTDVLLNLVGSPHNLDARDGQIFLRGPQETLLMVKRAEKMCLWRVSCLPDCEHSYGTEGSSGQTIGSRYGTNFEDVLHYRHILESGNHSVERLSRPDPNIAGLEHAENELAISTYDMDTHSDDLLRKPARSLTAFADLAGSIDSSLDWDMLSIPGSPESTCPECPEIDRTASSVIDSVANRLVFEFRREETPGRSAQVMVVGITIPYVECVPSGNDNNKPVEAQPTANMNASGPRRQYAISNPAKRKCLKETGEDDDNDSSDESHKKTKRGQDAGSLRILACPFYKLDSIRHQRCFRKRLTTISRLKQHLDRTHYHPFYCGRCLLIFVEEEALERHQTQAICEREQGAKLDGISLKQQREISRKSKPNLSDTEKWYAIWKILFPSQTLPRSPYIDLELSEDSQRFREYVYERGLTILNKELKDSGLVSTNEGADRILDEVLSKGLDKIYNQWLSTTRAALPDNFAQSLASGGHSENGGSATSPKSTPAHSFVDSAIGLRSNTSQNRHVQQRASSLLAVQEHVEAQNQLERVGVETDQHSSIPQNNIQLLPSLAIDPTMDTQPEKLDMLQGGSLGDMGSSGMDFGNIDFDTIEWDIPTHWGSLEIGENTDTSATQTAL